jgi:hypothetical protein
MKIVKFDLLHQSISNSNRFVEKVLQSIVSGFCYLEDKSDFDFMFVCFQWLSTGNWIQMPILGVSK